MEMISATRFPGQIYGKEVLAKKLETDFEEILRCQAGSAVCEWL